MRQNRALCCFQNLHMNPSRRLFSQAITLAPAVALLGCAATNSNHADRDTLENGENSQWAGWHEHRFPGKRPTQYRVELDPAVGVQVVKATAKGSASMLRKRMLVAPDKLGTISFAWRAERINVDADIGDVDATDAPLRVVLAFDGDRSRWSGKDTMLNELSRVLMGEEMPYATLIYTWCAQSVKDSVVNNPRTQTVRNLILESGQERQGQWLSYRRNVREDFKRVFGEDPGPLTSLALMTDADNTQSLTEGWYREVKLETV
jgi:Protein of unknown function (DUF3047)